MKSIYSYFGSLLNKTAQAVVDFFRNIVGELLDAVYVVRNNILVGLYAFRVVERTG